MDDKSQNKITYNRQAVPLAEKFATIGPRTKHIHQAFSLIKKENPNVLELGCGDGRDAKEIIKLTKNYLGIDISPEMIRLAQKTVKGGKFLVADFENFKFPKRLDTIFAFAALLHTNKKNLKLVLNQAHRSLNNGGIFYISVKYGQYKRSIVNDEYGRRIFYFYTPIDIKKIASDKFKVVYQRIENVRNNDWTEIILQKI